MSFSEILTEVRGPRRRPPDPRLRALVLLGAGGATAAAFGGVARASAARATEAPDRTLHAKMRRKMHHPGVRAARSAAPSVDKAGKWWIYTPVAVAAAGVVLLVPAPRRGRKRPRRATRSRVAAALAILAVPGLVSALSPLLDQELPQPPVGPRKRPLDHPVFPSGHAFRVTAIAGTTAYLLSREEIVAPVAAYTAASLASVVLGVSRLLREKHLASDVIGGWLGGAAIAALTLSAYELSRGER